MLSRKLIPLISMLLPLTLAHGSAASTADEEYRAVVANTAAMQAADWGGAAAAPLSVRVAQISPRFGAGAARAAELNF